MNKNTWLGLVTAAIALFGTERAHAVTTYTVTTACDDAAQSCSQGSVTLRDAINSAITLVAASGPQAVIIKFNISTSDPGCSAGICTIPLAAALPSVGAMLTLTIDGSMSTQSIVINGQGGAPMIQNNGPLTLNALTVENFSCISYQQNCAFSTLHGFAPLTITNSTFMNNAFPTGDGGAILMENSTLTVTNSTFYDNSALDEGGAIACDTCTMTVTNSTFSGNTGSGGAIFNNGTSTLYNTIIAGGGAGGNCSPTPNPVTDGGGNLSDDNTCNFGSGTNSGSNVPDTGPEGLNLAALAANGGPTQTIALLPSSVAISTGVIADCPATDQRGVTRPITGQAPSCSSGAYQYGLAHNGTGTAAACTSPAICNISGGENQSLAAGTPAAAAALAALTGSAAAITENVCTVSVDPRQICPPGIPGNPYYNSRTLPLAAMCPNLPSGGAGKSVLPDYLCGGYGSGGAGSGTGFAVIQGIANGINGIAGLLNMNDANPDAFFPPGGNPAAECTPDGAFIDSISDGWGPWSLSSVEGVIPEGNRIIELTDGCGGNKQTTSGMSLTLIGVSLNLANATQELGGLPKTLVNFAEYKYVNLGAELIDDPIDEPNKVRLIEIITQSALFLAAGQHGCAEDTLYEADRYVINNAAHFRGVPALDPNSYGRTRARILNLFFTLFTRLDGQPNPITDLGANIGVPLLAPSLSGPPASCSIRYLGADGY